ncbi:MAG: Unknown protein [uncultured Sulfurovum sp.]|uniref:PepSY domain-containing protein n=1 Tax=uncultured Sulfurovum sp. TaxID=269237 RepID=A0A6S6SF67_9BACT|nr:MAG: Unknown protein [uncultured Sulfurovum sp.]
MKKFMKITVATLCVMGLTPLNAEEHHDHDHKEHVHSDDKGHTHGPRKEGDSVYLRAMKENIANIEVNAKKEVEKLVLKKKIPASWSSVEVAKTEKTTNNTDDWAVSFKNGKIKDSSKQTLYVFVSAYGKVVGANYTGK